MNKNLYLIQTLTQREIKRKYTSTTLGLLWIIINPVAQMIVMTIVFSFFLRIQIQNYWLFVLSGLVPWTFFTISLNSGVDSLIDNRDLIKKVPFNKITILIASVLAHFITTLPALFFLICAGIFISGNGILTLLAFFNLLLLGVFIVGLSFILSSYNIYYRDLSYAVQALLTGWFYITPIVYPLNLVPDTFKSVYMLNPVVGYTVTFQSLVYNVNYFSPQAFFVSVSQTVIILIVGYIVFKKRSNYFADWI